MVNFFSNFTDPKNRTLLLDLDETLVHTCGINEHPEYIIRVRGEFGEESQVYIE